MEQSIQMKKIESIDRCDEVEVIIFKYFLIYNFNEQTYR